MLTINELRDQFTLQGEIEVKSFNEMGEDEKIHYRGEAERLDAGSFIANTEVRFMYPAYYIEYSDVLNKELINPIIIIEIERE